MNIHRTASKWGFYVIFVLILGLPLTVQSDPTAAPSHAAQSAELSEYQTTEHRWSIQIGAFRKLTPAEKTMSRMKDRGYDPFYRYAETKRKGEWYRVYIGSYPTRKAADAAARELVEQNHVDAFMLRKISMDQESVHFSSIENIAPTSPGRIGGEKEPTLFSDDASRHSTETSETRAGAMHMADNGPKLSSPASDKGSKMDSEEAPAIVRLTLQDAIRYCFEGNREIDIVSYEPKQAQTQIESAESVYDALLFADARFQSDPNLESSVTDVVTEDRVNYRAGIRKPLKTGGSLSTYIETQYGDLSNNGLQRLYKHRIAAPTVELKQPLLNNIGSKQQQATIKIAKHQARISDAQFHQKVIEVTHRVVTAYWKLHLSIELVDINRRNFQMAEEVHRREAERHARGISQQLDVARAQSNAQVRRSTWLRSLEEYQLTMDRLKLLLNTENLRVDSSVEIIPVDPPQTSATEIDAEATIQRALEHRPEMLKAQQELMIRNIDQGLAEHQLLPVLDFIGRYSISGYGNTFDDARDNTSMGDDDAWEVGLQLEWAFGNRGAKSRLQNKSLGRLKANAKLQRVVDDIKLDVKQVLHRLLTLAGEIESNRSAMAAAKKVVAGEFTRFEIGQTTNEELLRAQDLLATTSRSFARAISDYNTTIYDLARAQGDLPGGISIENDAF